MAPKAMGISGSSCPAESPPSYGKAGTAGRATGAICWPERKRHGGGLLWRSGLGQPGTGFSSSSPVKFALVSCGRCQPSGAFPDSPVSSYLSHSCLQDLEPCLCFQFRLHQPCREDTGQALSSSMWSPPHAMLCQVAGTAHVGLDYFKGSISHGLGISC